MKKHLGLLFRIIFLFLFFFFGLYVVFHQDVSLEVNRLLEKGRWIDDVYVEQARYGPGETAVIYTRLTNRSELDVEGKIIITIKHLGEEAARLESDRFTIINGEQKTLSVEWNSPKEDYKGYLVEAWFISDGELKDKGNTAIDISSDWAKFPRYGYITNFGELSKEEIRNNIERLNRFHINGLQFYDWQYKHHQPLAGTVQNPLNKWKDIANRDINVETVMEYLHQAHKKNMMAMNYNLLFGAYQFSEQDGVQPEWGLYKDAMHQLQDGHPLPNTWATSKLILQNPANEGWQHYILQKEEEVFQVFPFDGWHVDQLGDRGRLYDYQGHIIELDQTYEVFLKKAKETLHVPLVMNAVNDYGQIRIAQSPVDFLYTEVWNPINTYGQLKQVIERNIRLTKGNKAIVLAAYMNYRKADQPGQFNKASVLLADAVIFASGGAHFELGDTGMLSKEYFPNNHLVMTEELEKALYDYYDFLVAYQNLLRDQVVSVERDVIIEAHEASEYPKNGAIWYFTKAKKGYEVLHFINFTNQQSLQWRDDFGQYKEPIKIKNLQVKYYTDQPVEKVFIATPDEDHGSARPLVFTAAKDGKGKFITFTIPSLKYWDMVYLKERTTKE